MCVKHFGRVPWPSGTSSAPLWQRLRYCSGPTVAVGPRGLRAFRVRRCGSGSAIAADPLWQWGLVAFGHHALSPAVGGEI